MRVGAGVDDDAVDLIEKSLLDVIDQVALVIALETFDFDALAFAVRSDHLNEVIVGRRAVDIGLSDAEHVQVGTVKDQYLHGLFQLSQDVGDRCIVEILLLFVSVEKHPVVAPVLVLVLALGIKLLDTVEL